MHTHIPTGSVSPENPGYYKKPQGGTLTLSKWEPAPVLQEPCLPLRLWGCAADPQSPSRLDCPFVNVTSQPSSPEVSSASTEEKLGTTLPDSTSLYNYKLRVYQQQALAWALGDRRDGEAVTLWRQLQIDTSADMRIKVTWASFRIVEITSAGWDHLSSFPALCPRSASTVT